MAEKSAKQVGYSGKSLSEKLGLKPATIGQIVNLPSDVRPYFGTLPDGVKSVKKLSGTNEYVHLFPASLSEMGELIDAARKTITSNGMIWVSWPKKSSGVITDITEDHIREYALSHGLVDVKVCAVSDVWSGLKLVIPLAKRKG